MANFNAVPLQYLALAPVSKRKAAGYGGLIHIQELVFVAPASGTAPAIGDKIIWTKLPLRSKIFGFTSQLQFNAGTAACTINLGDNTSAARHLAATAINAAGTAIPNAAGLAKTTTCDTAIGSPVLSNVLNKGAAQEGDLAAGTGIPTGSRVVSVSGNQVTINNVCTANGTGITLTATGATFETSDDSANEGNSWTSATDDCTLISTVAGAQVANNQVIKLTIAYSAVGN